MLPEGSLLCVDEHNPEDVLEPLFFQQLRRDWPVQRGYVDPAGAAENAQTGIESTRLLTEVLGTPLSWTRSPLLSSISFGVGLVNGALAPASGGSPRLYYTRRLLDLEQRTLRGVVKDKLRYAYPEDAGRRTSDKPLKDGLSDHTQDAERYLVVGRSPVSRVEVRQN